MYLKTEHAQKYTLCISHQNGHLAGFTYQRRRSQYVQFVFSCFHVFVCKLAATLENSIKINVHAS